MVNSPGPCPRPAYPGPRKGWRNPGVDGVCVKYWGFLANRLVDSWADRLGGLPADSAAPGPGTQRRPQAQDPHVAKDPRDPKGQRDENMAWLWGFPVITLLSRHSCLLPTEAWMPNSASIPSFWSLLSFWSLFTRGFRQAPQSASKDAALWWDAGSGGLSPTWGRHSCLPLKFGL